MNNIKEKIENDYKIAFKEQQNKNLIQILRNIKSEIIKLEKSVSVVTDTEIITTLTKYANQRKEAVSLFKSLGKLDYSKKEQEELDVVQSYLPIQLSDIEIREKVKEIINSGNYTTSKNMGEIINKFKSTYTGQAEGKKLAEIVKDELNSLSSK